MPVLPDGAVPSAPANPAETSTLVLDDIIKRVQSALDDPDGTYIAPEYVLGFSQNAYESLYNKLRASGFQFDEVVQELPNVKAGTPNLDAFMSLDQPLGGLVKPRLVEWKLTGQTPNLYRVANGPLLAVRDLAAGQQRLDSWSWNRRHLNLSNFSVALDLRVTGQFLFAALTAADSPVEMDITIGPALTLAMVLAVAKARGNDKWIATYTPDYADAVDDLFIEMVKAQQAETFRVGRCSRRNVNSSSG